MQENKAISLRSKVYDALIQEIIAGEYEPMDIITESELIEKYGVSKSPVRDALIELCNEKILVSTPRVGYRLAFYSDSWFESVTDFRILIEPYYLKRNWDKLSSEAIDKIELTQEFEQVSDDTIVSNVIEHWKRNQDFHMSIARVCADPYYIEILDSTLKRLTIAYAQYYWNRWQNKSFPLNVSLHRKLIQAMRDNKPDEACRALVEDIKNFEYSVVANHLLKDVSE